METVKNYTIEHNTTTIRGATMKAFTLNDEGMFEDFPLIALDAPSLGGHRYAGLRELLFDKNAAFATNVRNKCQYNEYGHVIPQVTDDRDMKKYIRRSMEVKLRNVSHLIDSIYAKRIKSMNADVVFGAILPHGPYKDTLIDSLTNPNINTAMSIRTICRKSDTVGVKYPITVVAFDAVPVPGYGVANKKHVSVESIQEVSDEQLAEALETGDSVVVTESLNCQELLDALKVDRVYKETTYRVVGKTLKSGKYVGPAFHIMFGGE